MKVIFAPVTSHRARQSVCNEMWKQATQEKRDTHWERPSSDRKSCWLTFWEDSTLTETTDCVDAVTNKEKNRTKPMDFGVHWMCLLGFLVVILYSSICLSLVCFLAMPEMYVCVPWMENVKSKSKGSWTQHNSSVSFFPKSFPVVLLESYKKRITLIIECF